jgi:hypothetical protein
MIIYSITNKNNGKKYIGQHCGDGDKRWRQHLRAAFEIETPGKLYNSMRSHGEDAWEYKVEAVVNIELGQRELDRLEIYFINKYNSVENGYNVTYGGGGGVREFCERTKDGKATYSWGQYNKDGTFVRQWSSPRKASEFLNCRNYRHIYHAALYQEGLPSHGGPSACGFLWKKVPKGSKLPTNVTPLNQIITAKKKTIKPLKIPNSSTSKDFEIGQYKFNGDLVNVWPNNAEVISTATGYESDGIRRNLRGEAVLTYGYMWKRFKKGEVPPKITSAPMSTQGFTLDSNLFYLEPILKVNVLDNDILNKFSSINEIPIPFMNQLQIYEEAISGKNINNDETHWIFESDFIDNQIIP